MSGAALHAVIGGRVQGVGFRYNCRNEARRLGLRGFVQNLPGGDVEVWAEGGEEQLGRFLQYLNQGPPGARVDSVDATRPPPVGVYASFVIEY